MICQKGNVIPEKQYLSSDRITEICELKLAELFGDSQNVFGDTPKCSRARPIVLETLFRKQGRLLRRKMVGESPNGFGEPRLLANKIKKVGIERKRLGREKESLATRRTSLAR